MSSQKEVESLGKQAPATQSVKSLITMDSLSVAIAALQQLAPLYRSHHKPPPLPDAKHPPILSSPVDADRPNDHPKTDKKCNRITSKCAFCEDIIICSGCVRANKTNQKLCCRPCFYMMLLTDHYSNT